MNHALLRQAELEGLAQPQQEALRLAFGLACARRVQHLLEDPGAVQGLDVLQAFVDGQSDRAALQQAAETLAVLANSHRGSNSIDGSAHAAVSATYAVANALAGKALEAASYAAYAAVYGYGGYAVNDPGAFEGEFAWQLACFQALASSRGAAAVNRQ